MSTLLVAPSLVYSASADLLARSHRSRRTRHSTSGHHGHFPWGLVVGIVVLLVVVAAVVFVVRRRRAAP